MKSRDEAWDAILRLLHEDGEVTREAVVERVEGDVGESTVERVIGVMVAVDLLVLIADSPQRVWEAGDRGRRLVEVQGQ